MKAPEGRAYLKRAFSRHEDIKKAEGILLQRAPFPLCAAFFLPFFPLSLYRCAGYLSLFSIGLCAFVSLCALFFPSSLFLCTVVQVIFYFSPLVFVSSCLCVPSSSFFLCVIVSLCDAFFFLFFPLRPWREGLGELFLLPNFAIIIYKLF